MGWDIPISHDLEIGEIRNKLSIGGEVAWNDFGNRLLSLSDFGPFNIRRKSEEEVTAFFLAGYDTSFFERGISGAVFAMTEGIRFSRSLNAANDGRKVYRRTTPRGGITYFFAPQSSVYFSYSQGFRVPTNDELFAQGLFGSNPDLKAVRSHNFEIGLKSTLSTWGKFGHRLVSIQYTE